MLRVHDLEVASAFGLATGYDRRAMADLFTLENFFTLLMLVLLQAVLGFDNLLYVSMESKRVPADHQARVRRVGVGLAIALRLVLLFVVTQAVDAFQEPFWEFELLGIHAGMNGHALIVLVGGAFIIWTAVKEIFHLLVADQVGKDGMHSSSRSVGGAIFWIVVMNMVFSFDSILSAMALTEVFALMATAVVISGVLMIALADRVATFLERNKMWEVLGLFILLLVGVMLLSEGGHLAHLTLFGYAVEPMAKSTFYFVLFVLVFVDIVQGRYQRKLLANG